MCVGVTVLLLPPTVLGTGYICWYQGHHFALRRYYYEESFFLDYYDNPPPDTLSSYSLGILTLGGTYYLQSLLLFPLFEGRGPTMPSSPTPTTSSSGAKTTSSSATTTNPKPLSSMEEFKKHSLTRKHDAKLPFFNPTKKGGAKTKATTATSATSTKSSSLYVPPQSITELVKKIAPAIVLRVCATSIAFYCAGAIQTYVAAAAAATAASASDAGSSAKSKSIGRS